MEPAVFDRMSTLGDPTRSRILAVLEDHELTVTELRQVLQLPQSTVSRHLRILAEAGWVVSRSEGTSRHYRQDPELEAAAAALWSFVRSELSGTTLREEDRERTESVLDERQERSREFFSSSVEVWDALRDDLFGACAELLPLFGLLDPGWIVADLGCGTGTLARAVAPFVRKVVAVDRSSEMLGAARNRLDDRRDRVEFREGELERLPLDTGEADVAILSLVLHYVRDPARALREAARVLRPGGRLILIEMRAHGRTRYREEMGHLWPGFERHVMEKWLKGANFESPSYRPLRPDPEAMGPRLFLMSARRCATTISTTAGS